MSAVAHALLGAVAASAGGDVTAPTVSWAVPSDGLSIVGTATEALNESSIPANTRFTLNNTHASVKASGVAISGDTITLTFPTGIRVTDFESLTLDYDDGDANPIEDLAGNPLAALSGASVSNGSTFLNGFASVLILRGYQKTESGGTLSAVTDQVSGVSWAVNGTLAWATSTLGGEVSGFSASNFLSTTNAGVVARGTNAAARVAFILFEGLADSSDMLASWGDSATETNSCCNLRADPTGSGRLAFATRTDGGGAVGTIRSVDVSASGHVALFKYDGSAVSIRLDDEATPDPNGITHTISGGLTPSRFAIGVRGDLTPDLPWSGDIAAVLLASSVSVANETDVHDYLAALGGL